MKLGTVKMTKCSISITVLKTIPS